MALGPFGQPPMPGMAGLFESISGLARAPRETAMDKVRRAVSILEEAREEDPKAAEIVNMALHVLKNGPENAELFIQRSSNGNGG